ncbi:MAG: ChaN family lipoprotein [Candidatus Kapabacteria bacterium]|nr:ChaN family lipoprotein [Candidatus Kapabacteria bacterium]
MEIKEIIYLNPQNELDMKTLIVYSLCFLALLTNSLKLMGQQEYFIYDVKAKKTISVKEMAEITAKNDVNFFGEFHDDSLIHLLQFEYLKELYKTEPNVAVSVEMFERDVQNIINDYLSGKINEEEFLKNSRPWPDYKKFYKPILELAKENKQALIAANIPRKFAAIYSNQGMSGIDTVNAADRKFIAREMVLREDDYQKKFFETMIDKKEKLSDKTPNQINTLYLYFGAQCIKDETMAESIFDFLKQNSGKRVLHFNGDFHSNSYLGTVQKLADRNKKLKIGVITPVYYDKKSEITYNDSLAQMADFVIFLTEPKREQMPAMTGISGATHLGENYVESHNIEITIDPEKSYLSGSDALKFKNPIIKKSSLSLLKSLEIDKIEFQGYKLDYKTVSKDDLYNEIIFENPSFTNQRYGADGIKEVREVKITYHGKVFNKPSETNLIQRHSNSAGIISGAKGEGIYLPGGSFYPNAEYDMANFKVKVAVPKDFLLISSGNSEMKLSDNSKVYTFSTDFPIDDIILVGGRYLEATKSYDGKKFSMFTLDSTNLADKYLDASIDYYKYYTKLFGKYPYKDFSIVENFFATGFGMPGYTLLSGKLMVMPWVTLSPGSLAHEFVHNWWGNSCFVDYQSGNWCEALTSFSSNYYYNIITKNEKDAIDWRKKSLISIDALPEKRNYPVSEFKYQKDTYDATVGYNKGGFIFYEVMKLMGEEPFFNALKAFAEKYKGKRAYWSNLASVFETQAKKDSIKHPVKKVLSAWLNNKVVPTINLDKVDFAKDSLIITINQTGKFYMSIPVLLTGDGQTKKEYIIIKDSINNIIIKTNFAVEKVRLDPDYESLRKLYYWEKPFSFSRTLNDNPIVVMPDEKSADYKVSEKFFDLLKESEYDFKKVNNSELTEEMIKNNSLIILGNYGNNKILKDFSEPIKKYLANDGKNIELDGKKSELKDFVGLLNIDHPKSKDKLCTVLYFQDLPNADAFKRIFHYLSYSSLLLNNNKPGRPAKQAEIFPATTDKSEMEKQRKAIK